MLKWFESVESGLHPVHPALPVELLIGAMRILEPSLPPVLIMRPFQERNLISLEAADHLRGKNSAPATPQQAPGQTNWPPEEGNIKRAHHYLVGSSKNQDQKNLHICKASKPFRCCLTWKWWSWAHLRTASCEEGAGIGTAQAFQECWGSRGRAFASCNCHPFQEVLLPGRTRGQVPKLPAYDWTQLVPPVALKTSATLNTPSLVKFKPQWLGPQTSQKQESARAIAARVWPNLTQMHGKRNVNRQFTPQKDLTDISMHQSQQSSHAFSYLFSSQITYRWSLFVRVRSEAESVAFVPSCASGPSRALRNEQVPRSAFRIERGDRCRRAGVWDPCLGVTEQLDPFFVLRLEI